MEENDGAISDFHQVAAAIGVVLCTVSQSAAQQLPAAPNPPRNTTAGGNVSGGLLDFFTTKTPYEFWLTCIIMLFGIAAIALFLRAMRDVRERRADDISRSFIVIIVIASSLILITAGYSNEQVAPAFGIFGTIVGYMLGRMNDPRPNDGAGQNNQQQAPAPPPPTPPSPPAGP